MKAFLMHADRDLDLDRELPANHRALTQDLELNTLVEVMAADDEFIAEVSRRVLLVGLTDPDAIRFRQRVLADCLDHPAVVVEIYNLAVEAIAAERKIWRSIRSSPDGVLSRSVKVLGLFVDVLRRLRAVADEHASAFGSDGFVRFFGMLATELDDAYFSSIDDHLDELGFKRGILVSAGLGDGNKGSDYVLRRTPQRRWLDRLTTRRAPSHTFQIHERDVAGAEALRDLRGRGINLVGNALAQSTDHILGFFTMLRAELAFYVGCLRLHERLTAKGEPICFSDPQPSGRPMLSARGLYDSSLALLVDKRVVGNDVDADDQTLVMITGANQGGKSTFLRSLGQAQLMMQCGMFVAAEALRADVRDGVFTHFKREEDPTMTRGKLDEELARMSQIADQITPAGLLLCNESFASTNEREGSEIARQVVRAFTRAGVKVAFVTHLFDLAHGFYRQQLDTAHFLRAERRAGGERTFRIVEGEPRPTSHGEDSYRRVFGHAPEPVP